jgi:hypothetical protein
MINLNSEGFIICPNCNKSYKPILERKKGELIQNTYPNSTKEEREQLISGLCSSVCWNKFLGISI